MPATTRRRGDAAGPPVPPPSRYWPEPVLVPGAAAVYRNAYQLGWPAVPETAHDGHTVTVTRQLTAAECDDENQPMYEVTCTGTGGTPFHVFAEELENPALTAVRIRRLQDADCGEGRSGDGCDRVGCCPSCYGAAGAELARLLAAAPAGFTCDPAAGRAFAGRAIRRYAADNYPPYGGGVPAWPDETTQVSWRWDTRDIYDREELPGVEDIIPAGIACGALTCPPGATIDLIITPGDPDTYQWHVPLDGAGFALCSPHSEKLRNLGYGDRGAKALTGLLREAAAAGNALLRNYRQAAAGLTALRADEFIEVTLTSPEVAEIPPQIRDLLDEAIAETGPPPGRRKTEGEDR